MQPDKQAPRIAVIVLGMHRSGTSAVVRALSLTGLALPQTMIPPEHDNPDGFFEPQAVVALNDQLLALLGHTWMSPGVIAAEQWDTTELTALRLTARDILFEQYGQATQFVLKDPRMTRLMPFWKAVLDDMGIAARYVRCIRNPLAVAQSLRRRDGMDELQSLRLWTDHVLAAELASVGARHATVHYEAFLDDPVGNVARLLAELGLTGLPLPDETRATIAQAVKPSLRHHAVAPSAMGMIARTVALADAVYGRCCADETDRPRLPEAEWHALAVLDPIELGQAQQAAPGVQALGPLIDTPPPASVDLPMLHTLLASTQEVVRFLQRAADERPGYDGYIDRIEGDLLSGWCYRHGSEECVLLRLHVGQHCYGPQVAALSRPDLPGNGRHGFCIDLRRLASRPDTVIALVTWDGAFRLIGSGLTIDELRRK